MIEDDILVANKLTTIGEEKYSRLILKTHVVTDKDDVLDVVRRYSTNYIQSEDDILFLSEKMVACTQERAIPMEDIKPRKLAKFLSGHVKKTKAGIGLGIPETMEMALRECGTCRILLASGASVIGNLLGKHGWFYKVAGDKARGIDGPCSYTLPPYNNYVVLIPDKPDLVARNIAKELGCHVIIIDANDLGIDIIGVSDRYIRKDKLCDILKDNPLGQKDECTPIGILRKVS